MSSFEPPPDGFEPPFSIPSQFPSSFTSAPTQTSTALSTVTTTASSSFVPNSDQPPTRFLSAEHPWAWVLIPIGIIVGIGCLAAFLHSSRRRRRRRRQAAQMAATAMHQRRRSRSRNDGDLEAGSLEWDRASQREQRARNLRLEGLNELGEAPPPYEKSPHAPSMLPAPLPAHLRNAPSASSPYGHGQDQNQNLPAELDASNGISELDAGPLPVELPATPIRRSPHPYLTHASEEDDDDNYYDNSPANDQDEPPATPLSPPPTHSRKPSIADFPGFGLCSGSGTTPASGTALPPLLRHSSIPEFPSSAPASLREFRRSDTTPSPPPPLPLHRVHTSSAPSPARSATPMPMETQLPTSTGPSLTALPNILRTATPVDSREMTPTPQPPPRAMTPWSTTPAESPAGSPRAMEGGLEGVW